jgi:hypothetical protein
MAHPTKNKESLMNKILSQMMINCRENVKDAQVEELQKFKDSAADFDWTRADYKPLLNFGLDRFKVDQTLTQEKQEAPVQLTQAESAMQTIVEVRTLLPSFF